MRRNLPRTCAASSEILAKADASISVSVHACVLADLHIYGSFSAEYDLLLPSSPHLPLPLLKSPFRTWSGMSTPAEKGECAAKLAAARTPSKQGIIGETDA
jgi:hypothetical protein